MYLTTLSNARLAYMSNTQSLSTIAAIPVVPFLASNIATVDLSNAYKSGL